MFVLLPPNSTHLTQTLDVASSFPTTEESLEDCSDPVQTYILELETPHPTQAGVSYVTFIVNV